MTISSRQLNELAYTYGDAILCGDRAAALHLAQQVLLAGGSLAQLYQGVLQPALYEVGRQWEEGTLGVAGEHLATAITQSVINVCAHAVTPAPSGPPRILAACVDPERHDLGLRMVADCLEASGWHTLYLGGTMPAHDLAAIALQYQVAVVALSATLGRHVPRISELISVLRRTSIGGTVRVLVGGQPFQRIPDLWRQVGADGVAADPLGATAWVRAHIPPVSP